MESHALIQKSNYKVKIIPASQAQGFTGRFDLQGWGSVSEAAGVATSSRQSISRKSMGEHSSRLDECVLCKKILRRQDDDGSFKGVPLLLPCLHAVCSLRCLTTCTIGDTNVCPICRNRFRIDEVVEHPLLLDGNLIQGPATLGTKDHAQFHHSIANAAEDDDDGLEIRMPSVGQLCRLHGKLLHYCENCQLAFCNYTDVHRGHSIKTIEEMDNEFKVDLKKNCKIIETRRKRAKQCHDTIEKRVAEVIGCERLALAQEAKERLKYMMTLLVNQELEIRKSIEKATIFKAKELNLKRAALESYMERAQQFLIFTEALTEANTEVLFGCRQQWKEESEKLDKMSKIITRDWDESNMRFHLLPHSSTEESFEQILKKMFTIYYDDKEYAPEVPNVKVPEENPKNYVPRSTQNGNLSDITPLPPAVGDPTCGESKQLEDAKNVKEPIQGKGAAGPSVRTTQSRSRVFN